MMGCALLKCKGQCDFSKTFVYIMILILGGSLEHNAHIKLEIDMIKAFVYIQNSQILNIKQMVCFSAHMRILI